MAKGKKTGGRLPGSLNKATVEAREACAELVDDPEYRRRLGERLRAGELSPAATHQWPRHAARAASLRPCSTRLPADCFHYWGVSISLGLRGKRDLHPR